MVGISLVAVAVAVAVAVDSTPLDEVAVLVNESLASEYLTMPNDRTKPKIAPKRSDPKFELKKLNIL